MGDEQQFGKLSRRKLRRLKIDELVVYRKHERAYALKANSGYLNHKVRQFIHPLLLGALHIYHIGKKIKIRVNGSVKRTRKPIIFAVSHIGMYDVEIVLQSIQKHVYLLSADEDAMYRTFDGWFFDVNGVIYVNPEDKADKRIAIETAVKFLNKGRSLLWCPEGTWNLSPNYVILPIHYGIIEVAVRTNAVIIPIGLEQYDKPYGIDFIVNIGDPFEPKAHFDGKLTKAQKIVLAEMLRSDMARLKMDAWEFANRTSIRPDYWNIFVAKRLAEWPHYTMDIIRQREFNPNGFISSVEVFSHLKDISIGPHNAFLAREQYMYMKEQNLFRKSR